MTIGRYAALIAANPAALVAWEGARGAAIAELTSSSAVRLGSRAVVFAETPTTHTLGPEGVVLGDIYRRGDTRMLDTLEPDDARRAVASNGDWLIQSHHGSFVSLMASGDCQGFEIIRAPFGSLGCLWTNTPAGLAVASDVELLVAASGIAPEIDWASLSRQLCFGDVDEQRTCLINVNELSGGERLTDLGGQQIIGPAWNVWAFTAPGERICDPQEAAQRVRGAVDLSIKTHASAYEGIVLRLSGGLDSSIVAASLVRAGRPFTALTMVTRDRAGDERGHARTVASHLGIELIEAPRKVADVNLAASDARGLPRPSARGFAQASMRVATEVARRQGATAIFDGGGGDNMFAALQSPAPAVDCLEAKEGGAQFWKTARSIGIASGTATLEVARRAFLRKLTRGPAFRWPVDTRLLSADAARVAGTSPNHPWLRPPPDTLPGSAAHVALLAGAISVVQGRNANASLPAVSPLITQPVAETCLRVPSWLWTRDGHNRTIARDAFRGDLPTEIINRRDKGAPDSFLLELIEANAGLVASMLYDGLLTRHGLLDIKSVAAALHPARLAKGLGYIRVMQLVDAEAWANSWGGDGAPRVG